MQEFGSMLATMDSFIIANTEFLSKAKYWSNKNNVPKAIIANIYMELSVFQKLF